MRKSPGYLYTRRLPLTQSQEEEVQKIVLEREQLRLQLNILQQQQASISESLNDFSIARDTLDGLSDEKSETELLVPLNLSGFIHLEVKMKEADRVLLSQGADVNRFVSMQVAKTACEERMNILEKMLQDNSQNIQKVYHAIQVRETRLQELLRQS
jgi:prefoldin alpha subunit